MGVPKFSVLDELAKSLASHTRDYGFESHIHYYASMAEGFMHLTLNQAIKVRVLVGVQFLY